MQVLTDSIGSLCDCRSLCPCFYSDEEEAVISVRSIEKNDTEGDKSTSPEASSLPPDVTPGNSNAPFRPLRKQSNSYWKELAAQSGRKQGQRNMFVSVQKPANAKLNEWIAVNTIEFYNDIIQLYGLCVEDAKRFTQFGEGFPPAFEYRWADSSGKVLRVSSPLYVEYAIDWIQEQLDNESIFPSDENADFPDDFLFYVRVIYKKMLRIFAIMYHHHFDCISQAGQTSMMNLSFKRFLMFMFTFKIFRKNHEEFLAFDKFPPNVQQSLEEHSIKLTSSN